MNKAEFLDTLRRALSQLPPEELEKQIAYYEELFADMQEDGLSEQEAAAKLGDPTQIAQELLIELPLGTLVKSCVKSAGRLSGLNIVLLVLGFPVWFPLLLSFGAVLLAVLIVLWSLVLSFGVVVLALGIVAVAAPIGLFVKLVSASPLLLIGSALIAGGLCVLGALALKPLCRGMAKLCTAIFKGIKSLFIKKEG
ncbi:MAG: DUF1700 domain-containing protein [Oscillospiraceae bacterium]|nr:DUF1700 domain-containing protein [Oscillospiraceae bacterium]